MANHEKPKRRLPVLQPNRQADGEDEDRPPWHWAVLGMVAIMALWLPLSMLAAKLNQWALSEVVPAGDPAAVAEAVRALTPGQRIRLSLLAVVGPMASLALAALLGGALVGFATRADGRVAVREATLAGAAAAILASALVAWEMIGAGHGDLWSLSAAILVVLGGLSARAGAWWMGRRAGR